MWCESLKDFSRNIYGYDVMWNIIIGNCEFGGYEKLDGEVEDKEGKINNRKKKEHGAVKWKRLSKWEWAKKGVRMEILKTDEI